MHGLPPLPSWVSAVQPCHRLAIEREVAFHDCDPMGVMWHGNYLAYAEAAREALGQSLDFGVARLRSLGLFAPIVRTVVVHRSPARPGECLRIEAALFPTAQPRLLHRYRCSIADRPVADIETEQVLTDHDFTLVLQQPAAMSVIMAASPSR